MTDLRISNNIITCSKLELSFYIFSNQVLGNIPPSIFS